VPYRGIKDTHAAWYAGAPASKTRHFTSVCGLHHSEDYKINQDGCPARMRHSENAGNWVFFSALKFVP